MYNYWSRGELKVMMRRMSVTVHLGDDQPVKVQGKGKYEQDRKERALRSWKYDSPGVRH